MLTPNTWPTLDAGSVLTNSTRCPASASWMAVAQAIEVLPTPPLPVKKRKRGGCSRKFMIYGSLGQQHLPPEQQLSADLVSGAGCSMRAHAASSTRLG